MRVVVAAVVVLGCQTTSDRKPTPLDDPRGPAIATPVCARLDRGAWRTEGCRTDKILDADGDAVADCVRVATTREVVKLWAWPRCSGAPIEVAIPRWNERKQVAERQLAMGLPDRINSLPWAQAIAAILVGRDHVQCERASTVCAAPDPALGWISDTSRPGPRWSEPANERGADYEPRWQDGEPVLPQTEALVLDPSRDRRLTSDAHRDVTIDLAGAQLVVLDASGLFLDVAAKCPRFDVLASGWLTIVVDAQSHRWSVVLVPGDGAPLTEAACRDGVVFVPHSIGVDAIGLVSIRPDTGRFRDDVPDTANWRTSVASGVIEVQPMLSVRQIEALLARTQPRESKACADTAVPLSSIDPQDPCEPHGREDVDRDHVIDCWKASRLGNATAGVVAWTIELQPSCNGPFDGEQIDVNGVFRIARPRILSPRFVASRLVGFERTRCLPPTGSCPPPEPAMRRLLDQYAAHSEGGGSPLRWAGGVPELPGKTAVVVTQRQPGIVIEDPAYVMLYDPTVVSLGAGPLVRGPRCGDLEVWSAPMGGAVVDLAQKRWAWAWVASEPQHYWTRSLPIAVRGATCGGRFALFALADGDTAIVDMRGGKSTTIDAKHRAEIEKAVDPIAGWQKALADARGE